MANYRFVILRNERERERERDARLNLEQYNCQLQQKFIGYLLSGVDLDQFSKPLEAQRGLRKDPDHEYKREGSPGTSVLSHTLRLYKRTHVKFIPILFGN